MRSYNFKATVQTKVHGYVAAESEEEAIEKIKNCDFDADSDDILDEESFGEYYDIEITGYDEWELEQ